MTEFNVHTDIKINLTGQLIMKSATFFCLPHLIFYGFTFHEGKTR